MRTLASARGGPRPQAAAVPSATAAAFFSPPLTGSPFQRAPRSFAGPTLGRASHRSPSSACAAMRWWRAGPPRAAEHAGPPAFSPQASPVGPPFAGVLPAGPRRRRRALLRPSLRTPFGGAEVVRRATPLFVLPPPPHTSAFPNRSRPVPAAAPLSPATFATSTLLRPAPASAYAVEAAAAAPLTRNGDSENTFCHASTTFLPPFCRASAGSLSLFGQNSAAILPRFCRGSARNLPRFCRGSAAVLPMAQITRSGRMLGECWANVGRMPMKGSATSERGSNRVACGGAQSPPQPSQRKAVAVHVHVQRTCDEAPSTVHGADRLGLCAQGAA